METAKDREAALREEVEWLKGELVKSLGDMADMADDLLRERARSEDRRRELADLRRRVRPRNGWRVRWARWWRRWFGG